MTLYTGTPGQIQPVMLYTGTPGQTQPVMLFAGYSRRTCTKRPIQNTCQPSHWLRNIEVTLHGRNFHRPPLWPPAHTISLAMQNPNFRLHRKPHLDKTESRQDRVKTECTCPAPPPLSADLSSFRGLQHQELSHQRSPPQRPLHIKDVDVQMSRTHVHVDVTELDAVTSTWT